MINFIKSYIKKRKIAKLKKKAKKLYIKYHAKDNSYSCGLALTEYISPDPDLVMIKEKFNIVMKELKILDPNCPEFKL